jgi:hypothetical protein
LKLTGNGATRNPCERGYGIHWMGGAAWGGHTCPDPAPGWEGPRSRQRPEIIRRAKILRAHGCYPAGPQPVFWTADGTCSLTSASAVYKVPVSTILRLTVENYGRFSAPVSHYLQGRDLAQPVPQGAPASRRLSLSLLRLGSSGGRRYATPLRAGQLTIGEHVGEWQRAYESVLRSV